MGAINYFTSDYITMSLRPYDRTDFENDLDFMEEAREQVREYGGTLESVIDDYISGCYEADFENIETELNKHNFQYYHIAIKAAIKEMREEVKRTPTWAQYERAV